MEIIQKRQSKKGSQKMSVLVENIQNKIAVNDNINGLLHRVAELSLKLENFTIPVEISFLLVDDAAIREINREHRNIDKPTDVLSFPMVDMVEGKMMSDSGDFDMDENVLILGDIVISLETAAAQAAEYGHAFEREVAFLATHGMFHLLGYDHEEKEQEELMMSKQEEVLSQMRLTR